jgi:hypothetical protein
MISGKFHWNYLFYTPIKKNDNAVFSYNVDPVGNSTCAHHPNEK